MMPSANSEAARPDAASAPPPPSNGVGFTTLVIAIATLAFANWENNGQYGRQAIAFYGVAFLCAVVTVVSPPLQSNIGRVKGIALVALAINICMLTVSMPGIYVQIHDISQIAVFSIIIATCGLMCFGTIQNVPWFGKAQIPLTLALFAIASVWILLHTPNPFIDSFPMTQESCKALLRGVDPYGITYPNIYSSDTQYYPPGFAHAGRVLFGYCYPPITLLMVIPGYLATGDHRYAYATALVATAAFLFYSGNRRGRATAIGAALFMTFPRIFQVLESAWTEPLLLVLLSMTIFAASRWRAALPWIFGLFIASKQHMFLFAPAALFLFQRPLDWRDIVYFYAKSASIAILVTLPMILWNFNAFYHSVIELQLAVVPRFDGLSFVSFLHDIGWSQPPRFTSLLLVPVAYIICWFRVPKNLFGFCMTIAFVAFCTLAFDQAFLNRNFFVYGAMTFAVATLPDSEDPRVPTFDTDRAHRRSLQRA